MKNIFLLLSISTFINIANSQELQKVFPALEVLSDYQNVRDFTISSSGNEVYVTIQSPRPLEEISIIACVKKKNGIWQKPEITNFSGNYKDLEPFLSPNQLKLYFASNRPIKDFVTEPKDFDIWYVERENLNTEWSKPQNIGQPINTEYNEFYPSIAENNNIYFTSDAPNSKGKDDIFFSKWNSNKYQNPISLSESINTGGYEFNAFIAADESYLIFSSYNRKDGLGSGDLYISYLNEDNTWSVSKNLGKNFNSKYMDYCPFVDSSTNMLYFTSRRSTIKNNSFKSINEFEKEINKYENGLSRIYKTTFQKN